jgi:hypothetical protein
VDAALIPTCGGSLVAPIFAVALVRAVVLAFVFVFEGVILSAAKDPSDAEVSTAVSFFSATPAGRY